jgi:hypothetical protein
MPNPDETNADNTNTGSTVGQGDPQEGLASEAAPIPSNTPPNAPAEDGTGAPAPAAAAAGAGTPTPDAPGALAAGSPEVVAVKADPIATGPVTAASATAPLENAPDEVQVSYFSHLVAVGERMSVELKLDVLEDLEEAMAALQARAAELNTNLSGEINDIKTAHNIA